MKISNILVSLGSAAIVSAVATPQLAIVEEGKRKPTQKCNTLVPKGGKYFKKNENKRRTTHLVLEQHWTSSTSGSTIDQEFNRHRLRRALERRARRSRSEESVSVSRSLSVERKKKPCKKDHKKKKHSKRGVSVSYSDSISQERKHSKSRRKLNAKKTKKNACSLKVKPRKHRHHTRKITIDECAESSTYAFDVKKAQRHHKNRKASISRSYSASEDSLSASRSIEYKKKGGKKFKKGGMKKHAKRGLIEEGKKKGTRTKFRKSESFERSHESVSISASGSIDFSESNEYCKFKRIPACSTGRRCCPPAPCCPKTKPCPKSKPCPKTKKCPKSKKCPKDVKCPFAKKEESTSSSYTYTSASSNSSSSS